MSRPTAEYGTVSAGAVPFASTRSGTVLVDSAQYYSSEPQQAWQYMQDLSLIAQGRTPRFNVPAVDITPDHAARLLANATAATEAQLIVTGIQGAREGLASITEFVNSGGSLEGLEPTFFSYGVSLVNEPDAEQLLDEAAIALLRAGGLEGVFHSAKHIVHGRFGSDDILPIVDVVGGRLGFPAVSDVVHAVEGLGQIFTHPGAIAADPVAALEALSAVVKAPGHRLFTSVSSTLHSISPAVAEAFRDFRHSDVGQFVENVASIALGIGMIVSAPAAAVIKTGVHVVEGVVTFFKGVWETIFGGDDEEQAGGGEQVRPDRPGSTHTSPPAHAPTDEERKKLKSGEHTLVGCWVEDPLVVPNNIVIRRPEDGSCPDPDLTVENPFPPPGTEGVWPSTPQPRVSGAGVLGFFGNPGDEAGLLGFDADPSLGLSLDQVGGALGWDEQDATELVTILDRLGHTVPDRLAEFIASDLSNLGPGAYDPAGDRGIPSVCVQSVDGSDALALGVGVTDERLQVVVIPMRRGTPPESEVSLRNTVVVLGDTTLDTARAAIITSRTVTATTQRAVITEWAYWMASADPDNETNPIRALGTRSGRLRLARVPSFDAAAEEIVFQLQTAGAGRPWFI